MMPGVAGQRNVRPSGERSRWIWPTVSQWTGGPIPAICRHAFAQAALKRVLVEDRGVGGTVDDIARLLDRRWPRLLRLPSLANRPSWDAQTKVALISLRNSGDMSRSRRTSLDEFFVDV
jgi:hypothetical protein